MRRNSIEMRQRVDILHRAYENMDDSISSLLDGPNRFRVLDEGPFSLNQVVELELTRHRRFISPSTKQFLKSFTLGAIESVYRHEPNPKVLAKFGIERAMFEQARKVSTIFDEVPTYFKSGAPFIEYFDDVTNQKKILRGKEFYGFSSSDLPALNGYQIPNKPIAENGVFLCNLQPKRFTSIYSCDCIRPPIESILLVSEIIDSSQNGLVDKHSREYLTLDSDSDLAILCIGCGFGSILQVLSLIVRNHRIYQIPGFIDSNPELQPEDWAAIIVNLPDSPSWGAAQYLANRDVSGTPDSIFEYRNITRLDKSQSSENDEHVSLLLELLAKHASPGIPVILTGDPRQYHDAIAILEGADTIEIYPDNPWSISNRPIWLDYNGPQWAPHGLPNPKGKLFGAWRWK